MEPSGLSPWQPVANETGPRKRLEQAETEDAIDQDVGLPASASPIGTSVTCAPWVGRICAPQRGWARGWGRPGPGRPRPVLWRFLAAICSPARRLTLESGGWDSGRLPEPWGVDNRPRACGKEPRSLS